MRILHIPTAIEYEWRMRGFKTFESLTDDEYICIAGDDMVATWSNANHSLDMNGYLLTTFPHLHRPKHEFSVVEE